MLSFRNILLFSLCALGSLLLSQSVQSVELTQMVKNEVEQSWKEFKSPENGFSVQFPRTPDHIHQKVKIPKTDLELEYDTYVSEPAQNAVYVVSVWNYPEAIDMSNPETNLKDGFAGMIAALPGSEVKNMKMTELDGFKTLEFLVKSDDLYFQGRLILVHNTLYQVFAVYKDKATMDKDYKKFADSFKLLETEKRAISPPAKRNKSLQNQQINV